MPQLFVQPALSLFFGNTFLFKNTLSCQKHPPSLADPEQPPCSPSQVWPSVQSCAGSSVGRQAGGRSGGQKWPCSTTSAWEGPWSSPCTGWDSLRGAGQKVFIMSFKYFFQIIAWPHFNGSPGKAISCLLYVFMYEDLTSSLYSVSFSLHQIPNWCSSHQLRQQSGGFQSLRRL